jgi:CHAT domain-containing protein
VQLLRRLARAAALQKQFVLLSQLCGAAITGFEQERDRVYDPYQQDSYLRDRALIYELGVTAAWELGDLELVLVRADLAKARGALGWAASSGIPAGHPDQDELAALQSEWSRFPHDQGDEDTIAKRRALWSRLMTVQARARRAARPELRLAALQAALAPDEAILYYYFVTRETLVIYVITPTAVGAEWRNLGEIRAHFDQFADRIQKLGEEINRSEWDCLDRDLPLLSPHLLPREGAHLLDGARRLLICPHRILHHLPLHALDWQEGPLIERFAISYVPNVTSLLLTKPAPRSSAVLCVGIDSFPPGLTDLPGAEREADSIASIYRQQGAEATVLLGADASRARLEQLRSDGELERFAIIHLVTHGNDHPAEEPGEAALLLANGSLDAMDISQWTLHADLVALSACWSGRRPVHVRDAGTGSPAEAEELFGDEVYGLQAAFFAAGARQVLGTLWPVINRTAPVVMKAFHAGIACSQPPEVALQDAINQLRRTRRSVYHWAPYKLIALGRRASDAQTTDP